MERSKAEGDIGTQEQRRRSRQQVAILETEAVTTEQTETIKQKAATADAQTRVLELQQGVDLLKIAQETARNTAKLELQAAEARARDLAAATVNNEVKLANAAAEAAQIKTLADAAFYKAAKEAEAAQVRLTAEATGLGLICEKTGSTLDDYLKLKLAEGTDLSELLRTVADGTRGAGHKVTILATGEDAAGHAIRASNMAALGVASALDVLKGSFGINALPGTFVREGPTPKRAD